MASQHTLASLTPIQNVVCRASTNDSSEADNYDHEERMTMTSQKEEMNTIIVQGKMP